MNPVRPTLPRLLLVIITVATPAAVLTGSSPAQAPPSEKPAQELPIKASDTIRFETDEGTWMSLDVSPDGRTIVFDLLGDIYTLPIEGGRATRIVGGLSFESQPRFAPDGRSIAFLSDRSGVESLWRTRVDGSEPAAISTEGPTNDRPQIMSSPAWTADGQFLLVSKQRAPDNTFGVFLYHRDGGTGVRLGPAPPRPPEPGTNQPPRPQPNKLGAVASPDGRYVYYAQRMGSFTYNAQLPLWQIVRFDRETSDASTITNAPGSAMRPVLSPDGHFLVYATRLRTATGLRVRDLRSGAERWLVYPVTRDDQESRASRDTMPGYAFLPDGQSLVVPIGGRIQRVDFASGRTTPIPFTASVEAEIAPRVYFETRVDDGPTVRARLIRWAALSPDGRRVAFSALNHVWVADAAGGTPSRLTSLDVPEFMPAWAPDGRSLVLVTWTTEGGHLYRVPAGGGAPQQLTRVAGAYGDPVFTPDGSRIVFLAGRTDDQLYADLSGDPHVYPDMRAEGEIAGLQSGAPLELRWIPSDGGDATTIGGAERGRYPHFANDRDRVFFTTPEGLTSLRLDGYDRRVHLKVTGNGAGPSLPEADAIKLSPSGTQALINLQGRHYLLAVPRAGKEVVEVKIAGKGDTPMPVRRLSAEGGDDLSWTADGRALTWALGSRFFRQDLDADSPTVVDFTVEAPRPRPSGTLVLRNARIITMRGDEVIERGDVVIAGNRIEALGPSGRVRVPADARSIDVRGKTIMPGFVDAHAHMWAPRTLHQTQVWQYAANLAYGVTTTRDPQTSTNDVFAYADLVDIGAIPGPRIYATGPGVFSSSGISDRQAAFDFIKRYRDAYRSHTLKQYVTGDRIVRQWVIEACKEYGITATTEGALDLKMDLTQMADGFSGHEHSLPIIPIYKDVTQFVARTGTFYTPTILVAYGAPWTENYWFEREDVVHDRKLARFVPAELLHTMLRRRAQWFIDEEYQHTGIAKGVADVVHAGGRSALGSHGQMQGLGAHWEIWNLQSGGLTPHETLRVVTLFGAQAIGLQRDVGSLEPGKLADLLVLDRNPLEGIRNTNTIRYVMKNGELYEGDTLDMIWPAEKKLPPQFWWRSDPTPAR